MLCRRNKTLKDLNAKELTALIPLGGIGCFIGCLSKPILSTIDMSVQKMLSLMEQKATELYERAVIKANTIENQIMLEPISLNMAELNLPALLPMAILAMGALAIIVCRFSCKRTQSCFTMIGVLFIILDLGAVIGFNGPVRGFFDSSLVDGIATLAQIITLVASAFFLPLSLSNSNFKEFEMAEFYALFLFMIVGFQFAVVSDNLILIFIGLETSSLALYTLHCLAIIVVKAFEANLLSILRWAHLPQDFMHFQH